VSPGPEAEQRWRNSCPHRCDGCLHEGPQMDVATSPGGLRHV
jgi:hypothetical protein